MNDSTVISPTQEGARARRDWLFLIHQIPPKPDYFRVKVRRRLQRIGAVALKNSVYILPVRPETIEDFRWLRREITADGGEATVCQATFVEGASQQELEGIFARERDTEYAEVGLAAEQLGGRLEDEADRAGAEAEL